MSEGAFPPSFITKTRLSKNSNGVNHDHNYSVYKLCEFIHKGNVGKEIINKVN